MAYVHNLFPGELEIDDVYIFLIDISLRLFLAIQQVINYRVDDVYFYNITTITADRIKQGQHRFCAVEMGVMVRGGVGDS